MGRFKIRIVKWLSLALALLLLIGVGQICVFRNMSDDQIRIEGFYLEPPDSMDVVFLGSSEIFADFSSAQAYREFGFTSYPFAVNANPVTLWKEELKEVIRQQHPQLIVVETNGALYDEARLFREASVRRLVDNMPDSEVRQTLIRDYGKDTPISYALPFIKYHDSWEHPKGLVKGAADTVAFKLSGKAYLKGATTKTDRLAAGSIRDIRGDTREEPLDESAEAALRDFLDYCKAQHLDNIVFVRYPHCITGEEETYYRFLRSNAAGTMIQSYGFDFINLEQIEDEIGIDPEKDFYNPEHMNIYGMQKLTTWFGKYLVEHYGIAPRPQTEENRRLWEESAVYMEAFYAYCDEAIQKEAMTGEELYESAKVMRQLKTRLVKAQ